MTQLQDPAKGHRYITTVSNVNIGPPHTIRPEDINIGDIARALAMTTRYYGHLNRYYSVAEHSVWVANLAAQAGDTEAIIPALFHDVHEAYVGDLASPQKGMVPGYALFEADVERVVREALGLPGPEDEVWQRVRVWDLQMLHAEMGTFRDTPPDWLAQDVARETLSQVQPLGLEWRDAEQFFKAAVEDSGWRR